MADIVVDNLTKTYVEKNVLDRVCAHFTSGRVYGIVGRNGSGKTVFLKTIIGIAKPTEGEIRIEGDGGGAPGIGVVMDGCGLYPDLTARQNLRYLAGFQKKIDHQAIDDAIRLVGLNPEDRRKIRKYSLGMRKRLLIAQAVMEQPEILILDEPTNSLDERGVKLLYEIVKEARARGALILIESHYREDIDELCDEVFWMKEGKLCAEKD